MCVCDVIAANGFLRPIQTNVIAHPVAFGNWLNRIDNVNVKGYLVNCFEHVRTTYMYVLVLVPPIRPKRIQHIRINVSLELRA